MSWFLKGNARRFFRIDMPIKYCMLPRHFNFEKEVYSNGINYFNKAVESTINLKKRDLRGSVESIREHKEIIEVIVEEVTYKLDRFESLIKRLSKGINVRNDPMYWMHKHELRIGFEKIKMLEVHSPKTYSYLKQMHDKFTSRVLDLFESIEKADEHSINAQELTLAFDLDVTLERLGTETFQKIPLIRIIWKLGSLVEYLLHLHEEFNNDHYKINNPALWKSVPANVSACGIAIRDIREFEEFQEVDIHIHIPESNEVLRFDGKVVKAEYLPGERLNFTAFNFNLPGSKEQLALLSYVQMFEVNQAMEAVSNARY